MLSRRVPVVVAAHLGVASACIPDWGPPAGMVCDDGCSTTQESGGPSPATSDSPVPTTSAIDTGDATTGDAPSTTTTSGPGTTSTTSAADESPVILGFEVSPDLMQSNGLIDLAVSTEHADGVRMQLDNGEVIELASVEASSFTGQIAAFSGLDNGAHVAVLTPWRADVEGETVDAPYFIALPEPGSQVFWETGDLIDSSGFVVAMGVLPDRRFIELGTYYVKGEPRCFLRVRDHDGGWEPADFMSVLPTAFCTATDLTVNPETGALHVLVDRKGGDGLRWWLGEIASWGKGAKMIGLGAVGDKALALARHPDMLAVCGTKKVQTGDLDAFAVLVRPGQEGEERLFDYKAKGMEFTPHSFSETARDCVFAGDTLALVGAAWGKHGDDENYQRDRLALLEHDVLANMTTWTVAGPGPGVQSRALAIAVDDTNRYQVAGYTCLDDCKPEGDLRTYLPGGELFAQTALGPLGSDSFGPHDIAWSPAGYMVIALGELQGQSYVFKVQAFKPQVIKPLWTFTPNDKQGLQIAYALAIDPYGKVCAGGIGSGNYPAFACIGS